MITKYKASFGRIEKVEVDWQSASSVWIRGDMKVKRAVFRAYYDTWDEAKAFLIAGAERELRTVQALREEPPT